ncbi:serine protease inhibitor 77Ba-like isoform X1 [Glossina fuscipes]|uniref:Serine protease inhibitor 77Ba-like isoform X1 n=1 Tax=Glossina fuscipes TaxID=7396 RepID=A0A9C5Z5Q4_9MUSC|nr:serine protease inhibitor 77Ba-like isoform X1 [Glossina fuscipes]
MGLFLKALACLLITSELWLPSNGQLSTGSRPLFGPPVFPSSTPAKTNKNRNALLENQIRSLKGAETFALKFFAQLSNEHLKVPNSNYMISPFAVWSLLLLLTEGAVGNTLKELRDTLHIDHDQQVIRAAYRQIASYLTVNTTTIEVASFNALFTDVNKPVNRDYEIVVERVYGSALIPVDYQDVNNTFTKINDDISKATRGLLPYTVTPQDFKEANLLLISSLYFKGQWRYPFNSADTRPATFYDEFGNSLGFVQMMTQNGTFVYAGIQDLEAHVLELPYGTQNRLSMLVILPKKGVTVNKVANNLRDVGLVGIFRQLLSAAEDFEGESVEVFLPKFTTQSHFSLRTILTNMGIADVFEPAFADLSKLSKNVFVSSIFHATRIIVNEEGTEAAAITTAVLANKSIPPKFYVDRPFLYLIVEKKANLLLFAGEVKSNV